MRGRSSLAKTLVARHDQLAELRARWTTGGEMVVLRGVEGIGKSRLMREFAGEASSVGSVLLSGRCTASGQDVPLRPISEALLGAARAGLAPVEEMSAFLPALARLVPQWGSFADADPSVLVLGEAFVRFAGGFSRPGAATVILLEDLQWSDTETARMLDYVADAVEEMAVTVIITVRSGHGGPGADLIERLEAERRVAVIDLAPLKRDEVGELARSCLGIDTLPDDLVQLLSQRTDGVPFLVEELLASAESIDDLAHTLPASVMSSVQTRLAALSEPTREIIRCAALLGRHFPWMVAADAAGVELSEAERLLGSAVDAHLLEREPGGYRFRHALTRDAVLADLPASVAASRSAGVLDALQRHSPALSGDHLHIAASLAQQAGQSERASALNLAGARRALAGGSLEAAETLAMRAREAAAGDAVELTLFLLSVWNQTGKFDTVREHANRLVRSTSGETLADVYQAMAIANLSTGRLDEAAVAIAAASTESDDPTRLAGLDVLAAQVALARSDASSAIELATRATRSSDGPTRCEALQVIGRVERLRDLPAAARAFDEARRVAAELGLRLFEIQALQELGTIDMYETLVPDRLLQARHQAVQAGAVSTVALVDLQLAALWGERHEPEECVAAALRCQEVAGRFELAFLPMAIGLEAVGHGKAGRWAEMQEASQRARATGGDTDNVEATLFGLAEASFDLHRNDLSGAFAALDRSMSFISAHGGTTGFPFAGLWALLATVLDLPESNDVRAFVRSMAADTPPSRAMAAAAEAVALGVAGRVDDAERALRGAQETLARTERRYRFHVTNWLVAGCAQRAGWGSPDAWLRSSLAGFEALGLHELAKSCRDELRVMGALVPRAKGTQSVPFELHAFGVTGRELDVLRALSEGLGNREIAARLFLSPRTVEKHIENLKIKTQRDRAGLIVLGRDSDVH